MGLTPSRVNAIAVEVTDQKERDFNRQLVLSAGSQLGNMDRDGLKVLSLSASHTNWALRLVAGGALHPSEVISVNGHASLELASKRYKCFAEHGRGGLQWQVMAAEAGHSWPELLQMIQASCNATLQKTESELQLLKRAAR